MKTISFVIPLYNEEKRLDKTQKALQELMISSGLKIADVIFVNDGSTDNTVQRVNQMAKSLKRKYSSIKLLTYTENKGKGYALRQGMLQSNADYTLFFDADISTPLSDVKKFVPFFKAGIDVVIGTRKNGKSTVIKHQPLYRELLGRVFTRLTQLLLNVPVTDFTCGFKAFSYQAKNQIFAESTINRWGYDAEVLFLAKHLGFSLCEKSVTWSHDVDSKVKIFQAVPQTLLDLAIIQYRHCYKPLFATLAKAVRLSYN